LAKRGKGSAKKIALGGRNQKYPGRRGCGIHGATDKI